MTNDIKSQSVEITSRGIRKVLNRYTSQRAIAEYIWNGFDAHATEVYLLMEFDDTFDSIQRICVMDNGDGIVFEELSVVFKHFYESQKAVSGNVESKFSRGKNGYGRFNFFKFANKVIWNTSYSKSEEVFDYSIEMSSSSLTTYKASNPIVSSNSKSQTEVVFTEICDDDMSTIWVEQVLKPYLIDEFAWYFKVHPECALFVNGDKLDCSSVISDWEHFELPIEIENIGSELFHCTYFQWKNKPNEEYSRFYYMSADGELKRQKTTSLNNKGDSFWHSVLVRSTFFNSLSDIEESEQPDLFSSIPERKIFKELNERLNGYLRAKRKPFIRVQAESLVQAYETEKLFSFIGSTDWDRVHCDSLKQFIRELYEVEPAMFLRLNPSQKFVFVRLLDQVMDTSHNAALFKILEDLVELEPETRARFANLLETTKLKNVVSTLNLITDRMLVVDNLKAINFDETLHAGEVKHLQKVVEQHYWIFGEEYRFICAEEVKFQEALNRYRYLMYGITEKTFLSHPDKYKEMDLFVAGHIMRDTRPNNLVIEIKSPTHVKKLTMAHYTQINTYINVVLNQPEFNDHNEFWNFMLIGLDYDDVLREQIKNPLSGLCIEKDNYRLYVKKWSQVLNEVDMRLNFIQERLMVERAKLSSTNRNIDEIMSETLNNSASVQR